MSIELKEEPTLKDFQEYVLKMKLERGFNTTISFMNAVYLRKNAERSFLPYAKIQNLVVSDQDQLPEMWRKN